MKKEDVRKKERERRGGKSSSNICTKWSCYFPCSTTRTHTEIRTRK